MWQSARCVQGLRYAGWASATRPSFARRSASLVVVAMVLAALVALVLSLMATPMYRGDGRGQRRRRR